MKHRLDMHATDTAGPRTSVHEAEAGAGSTTSHSYTILSIQVKCGGAVLGVVPTTEPPWTCG